MARWEFKLPDIGEGITEGEIASWHIKPGDIVKHDQPMVEIMTDKATVTITSPKAGVVVETHGAAGTVVQVHGVLVVFDIDANASASSTPIRQAHADHANGEHATPSVPEAEMPKAQMLNDSPGHSSRGLAAGYFNDKPLATPATRKLARDRNIDLRTVPPTGPQGRVTQTDVETFTNFLQNTSDVKTISPVSTAAPAHIEERVSFAGIRRKIAKKMAQSVHTAAHFTFVDECDVAALKALRDRLRPHAQRHGVKLTFLPFIAKAALAALKKYPILNSTLDETTSEIVYRKYYNLGIATSTDAGLVVPVVKNADRLGLLDIAREIDRLASDAKAGKSKVDDLAGSTFTITSLGAEGGLLATPILNFPEVGILGVHQIKQKPVVRQGQIVIGDVMLLSLSFDHRIVDGHVGAAFAHEVIFYLQDPDCLLL
ncbi:MAG: 2-oxo acid dehydrogenase subunit E2 [Polyangiaceae bacterium]|nr:2-oxo acid dehydrogenase subunit E2 [Polyangiaceae bacterium]